VELYDLDSWTDFRAAVDDVRGRYGWTQVEGLARQKNRILFRGHADSEWELLTTLERFTDEAFTVDRYVHRATACSPELQSFTGRRWEIPGFSEIDAEIQAEQSDSHVYLPCYDYLVYLRHHGFPSPLLDWTASPYVAAYFAYCDQSSSDRVAVFAYIEMPQGYKGWSGDPPLITVKGPYVTTHSRHFAQKAWYTVAAQFDPDSNKHTFCRHASVFDQGQPDQDILVKFTMPAEDRLPALEELADYNIDAFTLFQSEEALVKALAFKEFEAKLGRRSAQPRFRDGRRPLEVAWNCTAAEGAAAQTERR